MTTVSEAGEFGLIDRIVARLGPPPAAVLLGPGDDAAVVGCPDGRVVATVDVLVEGRHFRRDWSSPEDVGRKAAAQNLADVAAMGAVPTALLVGLACPPELPVAWAEGLADGLRREAAKVGAAVVGGDVVRSPVLTISVTALGDLGGRPPVTRAGARPGDLLVVVGMLGVGAAGLALLEAGRQGVAPELVAAHLHPDPPYAAGPLLAAAGATAMVDVSDGLLADVGHVADRSGVAVEVTSGLLPVDHLGAAATALRVAAVDWALAGGEEHALAATVPAGWEAPPALVAMGCRVVGRCVTGAGVLVDGRPAGPVRGWDHFRG